MAIRIEYILIIVFTILIISIFGMNPTSKKAIHAKGQKEIEFNNFTLYNIKQDNTGRILDAKRAIKYKEYMDFYDVNLTDELGHILLSNKAVYRNDTVYMRNNVKVSRDDGIRMFTDNLDYNISAQIVTTKDSFLLEFNKSVVRGKKLELKVQKKTISAYNVDASIWFAPQK